jgi:putative membrane protein
MKKLLVHFLVVGCALLVADYVVEGVRFTSPTALFVGVVSLSLVNALVRPVLSLLSLPLTLLTLGFFYLLVNAAAFGLAALLVPGFQVGSMRAAVLGALVTSVVSWFLELFVGDDDDDDDRKKKRRKRRD